MAADSIQERLELVREQNRWLESHLGHLWSVLPSSSSALDVEACDTQWITKAAKIHPAGRHIACGSLLCDNAEEKLLPGCVAIKADIRDGLALADRQFDHIRFCVPLLWSEITTTTWSQVIEELCRVARPGARLDLFLPPNLVPLDVPAVHQLRGWLKQLHTSDATDTSVIIPADLINAALRIHCSSVQQSVVAVPISTSSTATGPTGLDCSRDAWRQLRNRLLTLPDITAEQIDTTIDEYHEALGKTGSKMFVSVWRATTPALSLSSGHRSSSSCSSLTDHPLPSPIIITTEQRSMSVDRALSGDAPPVRLRNKVLSAPSQWRHTFFGTNMSNPAEDPATTAAALTAAPTRRLSIIRSRPHSMMAVAAALPTPQRRISVAHTFSQFVGTLKRPRIIRRRQTVMGFGRNVHDADTLHVTMMTALHGTHAAILQQPRRILNIAAGTGVWIKDTANKYPTTEFIGVDATDQYFSTHKPLASNCIMACGDITQGLPYPNAYFDYVYQRDMALTISNAEIDWLTTFKEIYRMLIPGGLVEIIECDLQTTGKGLASKRLNTLISAATTRHKLGVGRVTTIDRRLVTSGFHEISRTVRQLRMGKWAGLEGICAKRYYKTRVNLLFPYMQSIGVSSEELNTLLEEWEEECDTKHNVQLQLYCYLAYRPLDENSGGNSSHHDVEVTLPATSNTLTKSRPSADVLGKRMKRGLQALRGSFSWPRGTTIPNMPLVQSLNYRTYMMPRSPEEAERLDQQHTMLLHFLGTLCMAPISQPKRVLDLGTGTGEWVQLLCHPHLPLVSVVSNMAIL
ncbi:S-adenosyl-L-methionine-dependent methyltransferase [Syncephalis fuscata]|nr:S-adenosyl-L-methionine-dependent methyltransferase [Syncephalis fuscata]